MTDEEIQAWGAQVDLCTTLEALDATELALSRTPGGVPYWLPGVVDKKRKELEFKKVLRELWEKHMSGRLEK